MYVYGEVVVFLGCVGGDDWEGEDRVGVFVFKYDVLVGSFKDFDMVI